MKHIFSIFLLLVAINRQLKKTDQKAPDILSYLDLVALSMKLKPKKYF